MSIDQLGQHIRFAQFPELTFPSMASAFDFFEVRAKLEKQRAAQATGQLAKYAPSQARRAEAVDPCEQKRRFDALLEPANVISKMVRLPPHSYLRTTRLSI